MCKALNAVEFEIPRLQMSSLSLLGSRDLGAQERSCATRRAGKSRQTARADYVVLVKSVEPLAISDANDRFSDMQKSLTRCVRVGLTGTLINFEVDSSPSFPLSPFPSPALCLSLSLSLVSPDREKEANYYGDSITTAGGSISLFERTLDEITRPKGSLIHPSSRR